MPRVRGYVTFALIDLPAVIPGPGKHPSAFPFHGSGRLKDRPNQGKDIKMTRLLALLISSIVRSEKGATSIEYALIASLIFLAIVVSVTDLATNVTRIYQVVVTHLP